MFEETPFTEIEAGVDLEPADIKTVADQDDLEGEDTNTLGGESDEEEDDSPTIHRMVIIARADHTDVTVEIPSATGFTAKRLVLPGGLTVKKLALHLENVHSW